HEGNLDKFWSCVERIFPKDTLTSDYLRFRELKDTNGKVSLHPFRAGMRARLQPVESDSRYWIILSELVKLYRASEPACTDIPADAMFNILLAFNDQLKLNRSGNERL